MTISTTTTRVAYDGDGATSAFAVPFPFFAASELEVIARDTAAGAETAKTLGADYTVAGGDGAQGTVTALVAPPAAVQWVIRRKTARTQATDYTPNDPFPAETHEKALDRLTMIAQELGEESDRALAFPKTDGAGLSAVLPPSLARAGKVAAYDDRGQPTVSNLTLANIEQGATAASASATAAAASAAAAAASESDAAASAAAAATSAANASASATAAQAAAASVGFSDVVFVTHAQSPIAIGAADSGKLYNVDTSGGAVVLTLPKIATLALPFTVGVKKSTADANAVTINSDAADDFDDGTSAKVIASQYGTTLIPDTDPNPDSWTTADWAGAAIPDHSIVNAKLAPMAANTIKGNATGATADAADLTAAEVAAILPAVVGDFGSGGTKGLVPAPGLGDAAAGKVLLANGTWGHGRFTSSQQAIPAGGSTLTVAHGLGAAPFWAGLILHCVTGEGGYSVGDEIYLTSNGSTLASSDAVGFGVYCDVTNVKVVVPSNSGVVLANKSTGARFVFTPANWKIIVKAWL